MAVCPFREEVAIFDRRLVRRQLTLVLTHREEKWSASLGASTGREMQGHHT